jgi:hypothetical protein
VADLPLHPHLPLQFPAVSRWFPEPQWRGLLEVLLRRHLRHLLTVWEQALFVRRGQWLLTLRKRRMKELTWLVRVWMTPSMK